MKPPHPPRLLTHERERASPSDPVTFPTGLAINIISLLRGGKYPDPKRPLFPRQNGHFRNFTWASKVPRFSGSLSLLATTPPAAPGVTERKVCKTLVALKGRLKPSRRRIRPFCAHPGSMPSVVEQAKRALVAALKSVARTYGVRVDLTGDSPDAAVRSAYRRVFLRGHRDKGGSAEHAQRLSGAKGAWEAAQRASTGGRPVGAATTDLAPAAPRKAFRIQGKGALLTYFLVVDGRVRPGLEVSTCGARQGLHSGRRQGSSWIES